MAAECKPQRFGKLATPRGTDIVFVLQGACFSIGLLVFLSGLWLSDFVVQFSGTMLMFAGNVAYAALQLKYRTFFLLLNLGMFLFWLTRPLFGLTYLHDNAWMNNNATAVEFALIAIMLALFFSRLGNDCYEFFSTRKQNCPAKKTGFLPPCKHKNTLDSFLQNEQLVKATRHASLLVFAVCYCGALIYGYQGYAFSRLVSYETFHLASASEYSSSTLGTLGTMAPYAMCVYLATMPKKRPATIMLVLNILRTVPSLLTGSRGEFVLAIVFLGFYYIMRAFIRREQGWVTKFEVALVVVGIPLGVLGMGIINYARGGTGIRPDNVAGMFCDSLYKQGVTFIVLQYGFNVDGMLQQFGFKLYTLGPLVHTITQGFVGQLFLGSELLPETNSIDLAVKGSSYPHAMSFLAHWNYLGGEGYGTSFVLESYADFGYVGIAVVSAVLGILMACFSSRPQFGGLASTTISLLAARQVLFLPRGETIYWISFLWSTRFWLAIVLVAGLSLFLYSRYKKAHTIQLAPNHSISRFSFINTWQ